MVVGVSRRLLLRAFNATRARNSLLLAARKNHTSGPSTNPPEEKGRKEHNRTQTGPFATKNRPAEQTRLHQRARDLPAVREAS